MTPLKRFLLMLALTCMWSPSFLFIKLALQDYEAAKRLVSPPLRAVYFPKHKKDFAKGLIKGVLKGGHDSGKDFIPSIFKISYFQSLVSFQMVFSTTWSAISICTI